MIGQESICRFLERAAKQFKSSPLADMAPEWERLRHQVDEPCEVAIAGAVKRGKSTLLNALLGDDLAQTGVAETTATINYFRYGTPDPARPVRCHWRNGAITDESRSFLASLQGNDIETLRRAEEIEKLEFLLPHEYLRNVTLVDTPGTGTSVDEHENRTAEYLQLSMRLRERHDQETRCIGGSADAVIYALDVVGREDDRKFLQEFQGVSGGAQNQIGPYNAVGVVTRIDQNPDALHNREEVCQKTSSQFSDMLSAVVAVSAGVERRHDQLLAEPGRLAHFLTTLQQFPPDLLALALKNERIYRGEPELPVSVEERMALLQGMEWQVFVTLVQAAVAVQFDPTAFSLRAQQIAGFDALRNLLQKQFLERGRLLRWRRIVQSAQNLLNEVHYLRSREIREQEQAREQKLARYQRLLASCSDRSTAAELEADLAKWLSAGTLAQVEKLYNTFSDECSRMLFQLAQVNEDFDALKLLRDSVSLWTAEETAELERLLGRYGLEEDKRVPSDKLNVPYLAERQMAWDFAMKSSRSGSPRMLVAERACAQYGVLLDFCLRA